jgi:molybdenum cofactor synthesis domain-containing protein
VSDRCARGERIDESGPALQRRLNELGYQVLDLELVADGKEKVEQKLREICARHDARLVLTTGGSGLAPRDETPEGTLALAERIVPGLMETARRACSAITPLAALSRGVAVIVGETLIINLPGHPKAALETLDSIQGLLPHALQIIGVQGDCDRTGRGEGTSLS